MKTKIKSKGIKCSACTEWMALFIEDETDEYVWICPKCSYELKSGSKLPTDEEMVALESVVIELEKTKKRLLITVGAVSDIQKLRALIPELSDISISEIRNKLKENENKWEVVSYLGVLEMMATHAKILGLETKIE